MSATGRGALKREGLVVAHSGSQQIMVFGVEQMISDARKSFCMINRLSDAPVVLTGPSELRDRGPNRLPAACRCSSGHMRACKRCHHRAVSLKRILLILNSDFCDFGNYVCDSCWFFADF